MKKSLSFLLLAVILNSCGMEESRKMEPSSITESKIDSEDIINVTGNSGLNVTTTFTSLDGDKQNDNTGMNKTNTDHHRKLIRNAKIRAEVEDYFKSRYDISKLISRSGAFIFSENENQNEYKIENQIVIKVPSSEFSVLVDSLDNAIPGIIKKEIHTQDVTEQYFDLQTRIATKKKFEEEFLRISRNANSVDDLLKVQNDIRIIREEIESKEGQLRLMKDRITLNTITIDIFQMKERVEEIALVPGFFKKFGKGLKSGWDGILDFLVALSYSWPFWVFIIIGGILIRRKFFGNKRSFWKRKNVQAS